MSPCFTSSLTSDAHSHVEGATNAHDGVSSLPPFANKTFLVGALLAALALWVVALEAATPLDPFWLDLTEKLGVSAIQFRTLVIITRDPQRINWGFL